MSNYLVQPKMDCKRRANYKLGEYLNEVFIPVREEQAYEEFKKKSPKKEKLGIGFCGNIESETGYNRKTKKFEFTDSLFENAYTDKPTMAYFYQTISAALLLYRLICLIKHPIVQSEGAAGYKVPWCFTLKHRESGVCVQFREWKGAAGFGLCYYKHTELPENFKEDFLKLINLIVSPKSPHPYDDLTAGGVA